VTHGLKPVQGFTRGFGMQRRWQERTLDHDHGQPKSASRKKLGARRIRPGIFGNDDIDRMMLHQGDLVLNLERGTRENESHVLGQEGRVRPVYTSQNVMMVRDLSKRLKVLPPRGQENIPRLSADRMCGSFDVGNSYPLIAGFRLPFRTFDPQQGYVLHFASHRSIVAHTRSERVSRIHNGAYGVMAKIGPKTIDAAEAPNPDFYLRQNRCLRDASQTEGRGEFGGRGQHASEFTGFTRATKDQNPHVFHFSAGAGQ